MESTDINPMFEDVEDDNISSPSYSANSATDPIDLRTPSPTSEAEEAPSDATTVPLPVVPNPKTTREEIRDLAAEIRRNSVSLQALFREFITVSRDQHRQTSATLGTVLDVNRRALEEMTSYRNVGYISPPQAKIKKPIDVSEPSNSADPKTKASPTRQAPSTKGLRIPIRGRTTFSTSAQAAKTFPFSKPLLKASRKIASDLEDTPDDEDEQEEGDDAPEESEADSHSTTSRPGMAMFSALVARRKSLLSGATSRYQHVSTVYVPVDDTKYTLSTNSIPAVVKWYSKLMFYVKDGGTKHYCDLISSRIAEAIQRKCSITPEKFYSLNDQDTIDYLFAFVRPNKSLEWSQHFRTCLPYPAYSQTFLNQQTLLMKLDDLARFVDSTLDIIFVLGDYASPPDRDIRRLFESLLPTTIKDMVKDFSIDVRLPFLKFLPLLKDHIAEESDEQRAAAPLQSHLYSCNVMRASNSPGVQAFNAGHSSSSSSTRSPTRRSSDLQPSPVPSATFSSPPPTGPAMICISRTNFQMPTTLPKTTARRRACSRLTISTFSPPPISANLLLLASPQNSCGIVRLSSTTSSPSNLPGSTTTAAYKTFLPCKFSGATTHRLFYAATLNAMLLRCSLPLNKNSKSSWILDLCDTVNLRSCRPSQSLQKRPLRLFAYVATTRKQTTL